MNLSIHNLSKSFNGSPVLRNINLELHDGIYLLVGPSGCGKTTFLRILGKLDSADCGEITDCSPSIMFQEARLFPWLNVIENITVPTNCSKMRAQELINALNLSNNENKYPHELSGGMQRRVSIARTLCRKSSLYLFDEPLAGLDHELQENVCGVIRENLDPCSTAIIVSHEIAELTKISDCTLKMYNGEIIF